MSKKGARKTGTGGVADAANAAMAARMKKAPHRYPSSVRKEPNIVRQYAGVPVGNMPQSQFERGMLGGMLVYKAGLSSINPMEMIK